MSPRPGILLFLSLLLSFSCATSSRGRGDETPRTQAKDAALDKRAAQRTADRQLGAESDEQRWGFEAARERKRRAEEARRAPPKPSPSHGTDLRQPIVPPAPPAR